MLAIAVLAVWFGTLGVREVGGLLLAVLGILGAVLGIMLAAMALGWLGFGLFALADRLAAWSKKEPEWFQPIDES